MKQIFFFFNGKEAYGAYQCRIAHYDPILIVHLLLFALIFFKDPQQDNHPPIGGHVSPV